MNLFDWRAIIVLVLIFVPLERLLPARPEQWLLRRHWINDTVYLLANGIVIKLGLLLVIGAFLAWWGPVDSTGFVGRQPLWLQVAGALVVADAGFYMAHRLFHAVPILWRFHAVHHSIEELDWLAAHRVHPADQIVHASASLLPLFMLGFSAEAMAGYGIIYFLQSHLVHSNVRVSFGPLRHVFASPQFHHWHHANHPEARDRNFAPSLTWLDRVFGTLHLPDRAPTLYGTDDPVPPDYLRQLAWPLIRSREPRAVEALPR